MAKENANKKWSEQDVQKLEKLAEGNTPTGIIAMKLKRSESSIRSKASKENISLQPTNKSPYDRSVANSKKKGKK